MVKIITNVVEEAHENILMRRIGLISNSKTRKSFKELQKELYDYLYCKTK